MDNNFYPDVTNLPDTDKYSEIVKTFVGLTVVVIVMSNFVDAFNGLLARVKRTQKELNGFKSFTDN